jgi:hypothetical protein
MILLMRGAFWDRALLLTRPLEPGVPLENPQPE